MMPLTLKSLNVQDGNVHPYPIELVNGNGCLSVLGRSLPGVDWMSVALEEDGKVRSRWEIAVDGEEEVTFQLDVGENGSAALRSDERTILSLPTGLKFEPPPPIPQPASPGERIDVAVLLDATTRRGLPDFLLATPEARDDFFATLQTLLEQLTDHYTDTRLAAIAFGDHDMPWTDVHADELKPRFSLYPPRRDDRKLKPMTAAHLVELLREVPATSGGDLVDALADGLGAAGDLRWRREARKLLIVSGDSPGHSTEYPLPPEADVCTRCQDVDVEAMRLHRQGVEIVTIYHDPSTSADIDLTNDQVRRLMEGTRDQYKRLASYPGVALETSSLDQVAAAKAVLERPPLIGRRSAYGLLDA